MTKQNIQAILDSANDAIITINGKGIIDGWNNAAEKIFGWSAEEILGQVLDRIIPERFHKAHYHGIERVNQGGEKNAIGKTVELTAVHKEGHEFPIELSLSDWISNGRHFYAGIIRDISERKEAEAKQYEADERFRSIMQSANDAVISADSAGNVLTWNKSATRIFGYTEEEMIGKPLTLIIPERYRAQHEAGLARLCGGGDSRVIGAAVELHGLKKSNEEFPLELSLGTWQVEGVHYFCGVIRDISERKELEQKIRAQAKALKKQNETLEEKVKERTRDLLLIQEVTIDCMASVAESRDPETGGHILRTKYYVKALARKLKEYPKYKRIIDDNLIENLFQTAPLHDIGKVAIPDKILLKPGKLTEAEFEEMKKHTSYGRRESQQSLTELLHTIPCDLVYGKISNNL